MDNQRGLLLNWTYNLYQEKSMDELRQSLVVAMEIEEIRLKAQEELEMRDLEIAQLKALLSAAIKERDEAQENCQKACFEISLLRNQLQEKQKRHQSSAPPHSGVSSSIEDDCDESIGSTPPRGPAAPPPEPELPVAPNKPLPEKGKLLQAVMKAGPLLQTLLLSGGPLPQWRHPPPPIDAYQIPPPPVVPPSPPSTHIQESLHGNNIHINSCGKITRKRVHQ